ncbi:hypothetical protein CCP3SC15_920006 [Gammaproteobacteria bacterium]
MSRHEKPEGGYAIPLVPADFSLNLEETLRVVVGLKPLAPPRLYWFSESVNC